MLTFFLLYKKKWILLKSWKIGNSLVVQWLGLHTSTAGGPGSIPGRETKIPKAVWRSQKKKKSWKIQKEKVTTKHITQE